MISAKLKMLKRILIVYTIFEIVYYTCFFFYVAESPSPDVYHAYLTSGLIIQMTISIVFLRFIWKDYAVDRKKKISDTCLILLLNFIGMWLWFPDKKEIERLKDG